MKVRMKSGFIEDIYEPVARKLISSGMAEEIQPTQVLKAEEIGGAVGTTGVEHAMLEPLQEKAIFPRFVRTARTVMQRLQGR